MIFAEGTPSMRVFITGGTGLIGTALVKQLSHRGDEVVLLTRRPTLARDRLCDSCRIFEGDPVQEGPWCAELASCNAVINLAGESIFGKRWSSEFKALLRASRVSSTT